MFQDIRFLRFKKPHKNVKHDFRHNIFSISHIIGRGHLLSLALCLHECLFSWIYIFFKRFGFYLIFKNCFVIRGLFCTYNKNVGEENWKCFCFQQSNQRREKLDKQSLLKYLIFILHLKKTWNILYFYPRRTICWMFYLLIDKILGRNN